MVVLRPHPRRVGQQAEQVGPGVGGRRQRGLGGVGQPVGPVGGLGPGPVEQGGVLVQRRRGDVGQHLAVEPVEDPQRAAGGDGADDGRPHLPPGADREHLVEGGGLDDGQHPLLRLAGHDLERLEARLAPRHLRHVDVHADTAAAGRLGGGAGEARAPEVLDADDQAGVEQVEAGLDQALLLERVADLHARALGRVVGVVAEAGRGQHRHAADAVAPGGRAEQHGQVPHARRLAQHQALVREDAEAEDVDQRVVLVGLVEDGLAADGRYAHRVAVAADAGDDALGDPPAAGVVERAEPQRVHQRDGAGAHREDVAEDAADACRRPLVGLDGRGVVVALDAERDRQPVAHVDHAGVLPGPDHHVAALGGQAAQVDAARLVGAVLGPHDRIHGQFEVVRGTPEDAFDGRSLVVGQPQGAVDGLVGAHVGAA